MKQFIIIFILLIVLPTQILAQKDDAQQDVNIDDLGNAESQFQEQFFEALKQKGIENYGRAVAALQICLKERPESAIVHFELGKNYNALKQYGAAEKSLKKALSLKTDDEDILKVLYDAQFNTNNFDGAAQTVQKLISYNIIYKEDLAKLYLRTKEYDKALQALDEIDEAQGESLYRESLRKVIYSQSTNKQAQANRLEQRIAANPDNIQNYLNLIYIYGEMDSKGKAFETAKNLLEIDPDADAAHLTLYKGYLENNQVEEAIVSMKIALKSNQIDKETKGEVLKDFMQYSTENTAISDELDTVLDDEDSTKDPKDLALFYLEKNDKTKALIYFEKALEAYPTDYEVLKNLALLQIDAQQFSKAINTTKTALDIYPSQPLLYLLQGVAYNNTSEFEKALESLDFGFDYIIDDPKMEADIFTQMSIAHKGLGNNPKALEFEQRAAKALKQLN